MTTLYFGDILSDDFSSLDLYNHVRTLSDKLSASYHVVNFTDLMIFVKLAEINDSITYFAINGYKFQNSDEMSEFTKAIVNIKNITSMSFDFTNLDVIYIRHIIIKMQWLNSISMRNTFCEQISYAIVFDSLKQNTNIQNINLRKNRWCIGVYALSELFYVCMHHNIKNIDISDNILDNIDNLTLIELWKTQRQNNCSFLARISTIVEILPAGNMAEINGGLDENIIDVLASIFGYDETLIKYYIKKSSRNEKLQLSFDRDEFYVANVLFDNLSDTIRNMLRPGKSETIHNVTVRVIEHISENPL
jgi:hypothetical protein